MWSILTVLKKIITLVVSKRSLHRSAIQVKSDTCRTATWEIAQHLLKNDVEPSVLPRTTHRTTYPYHIVWTSAESSTAKRPRMMRAHGTSARMSSKRLLTETLHGRV